MGNRGSKFAQIRRLEEEKKRKKRKVFRALLIAVLMSAAAHLIGAADIFGKGTEVSYLVMAGIAEHLIFG